jgi:hypothetical protein
MYLITAILTGAVVVALYILLGSAIASCKLQLSMSRLMEWRGFAQLLGIWEYKIFVQISKWRRLDGGFKGLSKRGGSVRLAVLKMYA